jgi:hypothetical protein
MTDAILYERITEMTELCISPISRAIFDAYEVDGLGEDEGYFIYERARNGEITDILAKCPSFEAAAKLVELFRTAVMTRLASSQPVGPTSQYPRPCTAVVPLGNPPNPHIARVSIPPAEYGSAAGPLI